MWETQQLVISNIEEDVLVTGIKQQQSLIGEFLEAIESRDVSPDEINEMLLLAEKNLRRTRTNFLRAYAHVR